jgi:hypothetical protein
MQQLNLLVKLPELWEELTQTVQTDLPLDTALWLATVGGRLDNVAVIKSRFIDSTVVKGWTTPGGAEVLLSVYERLQPMLIEALAPPDTARARQSSARIKVLNGTSQPDWGALAADRLIWEGFEVVGVGPAPHTDFAQTLIVDLQQDAKGSAVDYVARVMQVDAANILPSDVPLDAVSSNEDNSQEADLQVVVGSDFRPCYKSYWYAVHGTASTAGP